MGTRSLTVVNDGNHEVAVIYGQWDGYPSGHGVKLAEILAPNGEPVPAVNGISGDGPCFNTASCAAAQIVAGLKTGPGSYYLEPAGTRDMGEEFTYTVTVTPGSPVIVLVHAMDEVVFSGTAQRFRDFCKAS
jgi:hypothetical protein